MKKFFIVYCAVMLVGLIVVNLMDIGGNSQEVMKGAPSVKSIRNNPAAFRSFSSRGFTGK